jgi:Domain of unknown function (DUF4187)/G-patch domain
MSGSNVLHGAEEEDDDDYMTMSFAEAAPIKETSASRAARLRKEGLQKGINKTKKEQEAEARAAHEAALSKQLGSANKGFKMLSKLGYKPGMPLGKGSASNLEPIRVEMKEDRSGIGIETEKKRKAKETMANIAKKAREDEGTYRDRMAEERAEKRREAQIAGAQKIAEKFDVKRDEEQSLPPKPLNGINVLWRELARQRLFKAQEERMKHDLLSRGEEKLPGLADPEEDADDRLALGKDKDELFEEEVEDEDPDVEEFNALPSEERLEKLVSYLRKEYHYCFWCKFEYEDDKMDGCPGLTEEDHD